ncbi:MAG TPA: SprT-like domain-containing protein [bacterium]|nr:SprT-like domain-containing protein [bacterium]
MNASEDSLRDHIARRIGARVTLSLTENATTMVSYRWRASDEVQVRMHRMFCEAESGVIDAVAAFVRGNRGAASRPMDEYIRANRHRIRRRERRLDPKRLKAPAGEVHDLGAMKARLNRRFFGGHVTAKITWGRQPPRRKRRHIGFGAYYRDLDLIRVNPLLDQRWIPKFFVEYIVYHEMCHAFLAFDLFGRDGIHTPRFRELERRYPRFDEALAWERANLDRLLGVHTKRDARRAMEIDAPQMKKRRA